MARKHHKMVIFVKPILRISFIVFYFISRRQSRAKYGLFVLFWLLLYCIFFRCKMSILNKAEVVILRVILGVLYQLFSRGDSLHYRDFQKKIFKRICDFCFLNLGNILNFWEYLDSVIFFNILIFDLRKYGDLRGE